MSEIGFKSILRALGDALQIRDVKSAPSELDTSSIKVVAGLDPGVFGLQQHQMFGASLPLVGLGSAMLTLVGEPNGDAIGWADTNRFRANAQREVVILGIRARVTYNGAGAAADANSVMGLEFYRQAAGNVISSMAESTFRKWVTVEGAARLIYDWSFPWYQNQRYQGADPFAQVEGGDVMSMPYIYVPAGSAFRINLLKISGAVWPAATTWDIQAFAVSCPKGMRPPGM